MRDASGESSTNISAAQFLIQRTSTNNPRSQTRPYRIRASELSTASPKQFPPLAGASVLSLRGQYFLSAPISSPGEKPSHGAYLAESRCWAGLPHGALMGRGLRVTIGKETRIRSHLFKHIHGIMALLCNNA